MVEYLRVSKWEKWQTYRKDRGQPPWIKVHRRIMRKPEWVELTDAERGQLVAIWLLAADHDGDIPASPAVIKKLCFMTKEPNLNKFIELGFICQDGVNMTSTWRQHDAPKAEAEENREEEKEIKVRHRQFVFLLPEEYEKLTEDYGQAVVDSKIEDLDNYIGINPASRAGKYKDHNRTIRAWLKKDGVKTYGDRGSDTGHGNAFLRNVRQENE